VGNAPRNITIDPSGRFVYLADPGANSIYGFSINLTTGNLAALSGSPFKTGTGSSPWSVAIDRSGMFLCVTKMGTNQVESFSIDPTSGNLTAISTQPTGMEAEGVVVDPTGRFVYVANIH
jgi:6-phosphogluconolactonase